MKLSCLVSDRDNTTTKIEIVINKNSITAREMHTQRSFTEQIKTINNKTLITTGVTSIILDDDGKLNLGTLVGKSLFSGNCSETVTPQGLVLWPPRGDATRLG